MQKGLRGYRSDFQLGNVGHSEALISLFYNTKGICIFQAISTPFPFELQEASQLFLSATDLSICPCTLKLERMEENKRIVCLIPEG